MSKRLEVNMKKGKEFGVLAFGADVTNRLNALVSLLERVNQKPPEETEEEKRKKRKLTLEVGLHTPPLFISISAVLWSLVPQKVPMRSRGLS